MTDIGFEELYFSYAEKNNIKFKKDLPVIEEAGSQVLPSIAILNETVYAAMMNKNTWDIEFTEGRSTGRSTNSVYRFDKPVRVNDDPAGNWHYAPSLAVDDEKNVCVAWLDARNGNYDIYFSHGVKENGIWQFSRNVRVNDDSTNVPIILLHWHLRMEACISPGTMTEIKILIYTSQQAG